MTSSEIDSKIKEIIMKSIEDIDSLMISENADVYESESHWTPMWRESGKLDGIGCIISFLGHHRQHDNHSFFIRKKTDYDSEMIDYLEYELRKMEEKSELYKRLVEDTEKSISYTKSEIKKAKKSKNVQKHV